MIQTGSLIRGRLYDRAIHWIKGHETAVFFGVTFLITWAIMGLLAIFPPENAKTFDVITLIAAYAPSISAVLLTRPTISIPKVKLSTRRLALFVPVLVLVAGIEWLDHIFWEHTIDASVILADIILVILATWILTRLLSDRTGARLWPTETAHGRIWMWVLVALGFWPLLILAGNAIARVIGISVPPKAWPDIPFPLILIESFFWAFLFGGPLNEEPGWRGFALPRLQARFSPLAASLLIGALWGLWHVPVHLIGAYGGGALGALIRIMEVPRAILFTWIYNRTKGNLLIMILFHAAINTTSYFTNRSWQITLILCTLAAATVVITDKMWRRLPGAQDARSGLLDAPTGRAP